MILLRVCRFRQTSLELTNTLPPSLVSVIIHSSYHIIISSVGNLQHLCSKMSGKRLVSIVYEMPQVIYIFCMYFLYISQRKFKDL
jgi:hypothetical protein